MKKREEKKNRNKKANATDFIIYLAIALAVIIIGTIVYFILTGKTLGGFSFLKKILSFGSGS